jgi:hypothetical protein
MNLIYRKETSQTVERNKLLRDTVVQETNIVKLASTLILPQGDYSRYLKLLFLKALTFHMDLQMLHLYFVSISFVLRHCLFRSSWIPGTKEPMHKLLMIRGESTPFTHRHQEFMLAKPHLTNLEANLDHTSDGDCLITHQEFLSPLPILLLVSFRPLILTP